MKARLIRDGLGEVKLLCADGSICNPDLIVLRSLLFDFRNTAFTGSEGSWSTSALDMSLIPGETLAYISDDGYLVIIDPSGFEGLVITDIPPLGSYISLAEYSAKHNVSVEIIKVYCRHGRILGAKKLPGKYGRWLIPENAPYPVSDSRRHKIHRKE